MTRKDYELIAKTINDVVDPLIDQGIRKATIRGVVSRLSTAFMADNPRFDPDKFTRACGF